jgi:putative transposase
MIIWNVSLSVEHVGTVPPFHGFYAPSLKGVSSRLLRQQRPDIRKRYYKGVLWSPTVWCVGP